MKEDILEQLCEDYAGALGYFTKANVKYRPSKDDPEYVASQDSVASDIDVLAVHPSLTGPERVLAISCKSWQGGFDPKAITRRIVREGLVDYVPFTRKNGKSGERRPTWKAHRELSHPKWARAFRKTILSETGSNEFTHVTLCTKLIGNTEPWTSQPGFQSNMENMPIKVWTAAELFLNIRKRLKDARLNTLESTPLTRTMQVLIGAGLDVVEV